VLSSAGLGAAATASALTMAHPELWFFLAPAEEGKEFEFGHMEEVRHLKRKTKEK